MLGRILLRAGIAVVGVGSALSAAADTSTEQRRETAKRLYQASCAACHGNDGRGLPVATVGFETPLPDFSDCNFATREPDEDWYGIVHAGGPTRAFDRMMPAFGAALTPEEMALVLEHVRTFCSDDAGRAANSISPACWSRRRPSPRMKPCSRSTARCRRHRLRGPDLDLRATHWREEPGRSRGAVRVFGARRGRLDRRCRRHRAERQARPVPQPRSGSIFSTALEVILPTGQEDKGFGNGTTIFEPFVAFGQILPSASFVQLQAGVELPADRDRSDQAFGRIGVGKTFIQGRFGRTWTPMVEVLAARELDASDTDAWDVVPQLQVSLSPRQHLLACAGVRLPLNDADHVKRRSSPTFSGIGSMAVSSRVGEER